MKTLQLKVDDQLYEILLAMLKGLPEQQIDIIENAEILVPAEKKTIDINQFSGKINWPVDGLAYQKEVRAEWDK